MPSKKPKMQEKAFGSRGSPRPAGCWARSPDPLAAILGHASKGRGWEGRGGEGSGEKEKKGRGKKMGARSFLRKFTPLMPTHIHVRAYARN